MPGADPRLKSRARKQLRAQVAALRLPCWRCGHPIDYTAPRFAPLSFALDEIVARADGGDPLDPGNVAPAHWRCNARAGAARTNKARRQRAAGIERSITANRW